MILYEAPEKKKGRGALEHLKTQDSNKRPLSANIERASGAFIAINQARHHTTTSAAASKELAALVDVSSILLISNRQPILTYCRSI